MISLQKITEDNWLELSELDIEEHQKENFSLPVVYWMAKCRYDTSMQEFGVSFENKPVGFCVYGKDPEDGMLWIVSLMIDKKFQGKGYGRQAVQELISLIQKEHNPDEILISHRPGNRVAAKLYQSMGFEDTGEVVDEETLRCLKLN